VGKYTRPPTPRQISALRERIQQVQKRLEAERQTEGARGRRNDAAAFLKLAREMGMTEEELKMFAEFRQQRTDPKRQLNPQVAEKVTLQVQLAPEAEPGVRELRLITASGLSNPLSFHVGRLPEFSETEPNDQTADAGIRDMLPVVVNGRILPGDVDRFSFRARKGARLVVAASARELIP